MKKLSLILALVLVLSCCILAACGDKTEESSAAESTAESTATSTAESKAEESTATSTEESTEASTEASTEESSEAEESKDPVEAGTDNLAAGKTYTACEQFRQGGAEANWGWSDTAAYAYPDEDGKTLTDGVKATEDNVYSDTVWAGWSGAHPNYAETGYMWMTIDLGEAKDLAKFVAYIGSSKLDNGIGASNTVVSVAVSNDGETFEVVGEAIPVDDANTIHALTTIELSEAVNAQYVQFRFVRGGWVFLSELEVYAAA